MKRDPSPSKAVRSASARNRISAEPAAGDSADSALPRLVELHGPKLYTLASRLCGNAADAEDMVQEVFLQAYRKWHTFKGDANPGTWLYAIAAHSCKARTRRKGGIDRRMPAFSQLMPWSESTNADLRHTRATRGSNAVLAHTDSTVHSSTSEDQASGPVAEAIRNESSRAVYNAIMTLPDSFRVPLVLKEMLELSIEDVAHALHVKPQTIKTRVHRARLLLRKAILASRGIPKRPAQSPTYERQVCLDLLKAKLDAMDKGRGFPIGQNVVCERCRAVFAELDLAQSACAGFAEGSMPLRVRHAILRAMEETPKLGTAKRSRRS